MPDVFHWCSFIFLWFCYSQTAECPVCGMAFPAHLIEAHAAECGDASSSNESEIATVANTIVQKSTEDVLQFLADRVDAAKEFRLCIDRQDLLESTLSQWQKKKNSSPVNVLKVVFLGEAGVDTGALRKEFLTDVMTALEDRFFEGPGEQGKWPKYSTTDLETNNFRAVGEIMALSLAQGGPPPAFLKNWCYNIICHGEIEHSQLTAEDVADCESAELIAAVENCTDTGALLELSDGIISCGYSRVIALKNKASIIRAIVLHSTMRIMPMLLQLRKGLQLYGLQSEMATHPEACHGLFVPGRVEEPDADFLLMSCKAHYSDRGTQKEREERKIMKFFQDFLEQIETKEVWEESVDESETKELKLTVGDVLKWMTGIAHVPILPAEKRDFIITIQFDHNCAEHLGEHKVCYPTVSACTQTVTLPVQHLSTFEQFTTVFGRAVCGSAGFHRV
ncbi:uncharacterized protein LOC134450438 isoform X2 [Engraulis encrasicolus]|uniref:uncharacterized protein LOC134450438 isoform X2 n=1 Tax=Engraulis encrasicolus TaxID=184585 RepID=UPI002FD61C20